MWKSRILIHSALHRTVLNICYWANQVLWVMRILESWLPLPFVTVFSISSVPVQERSFTANLSQRSWWVSASQNVLSPVPRLTHYTRGKSMWGMAPSPPDRVPLPIRFLPPHWLRQEYPQLTIYLSALFELSPVSGDVMVQMLGNNRTPRLSNRFLQRIDSKEMGNNQYTCSLPKGDKRSLYAPVDRTSGGRPTIYQDISGIRLFTRSNLSFESR